MLFQQIYNWIKYKTLPSSILFKNRLFIERDSKNRRIFNNFGLTFRNSKWSNYETTNIKNQFKKNYLSFFFFLFSFFLLFILIKNFNYIYLSYFFNNFFFYMWLSLDTFDYYISFIIWILFLFITYFINLIYSFFFYKNFKSTNIVNLQNITNLETIKISKKDYKVFLLNWLNNKNITLLDNKIKINILENFFIKSKNNNLIFEKNIIFFNKLYKLIYFLNLNENSNNNIFNLNYKISQFLKNTNNSLIFYTNTTQLSNKYSSLIFWYILKNQNNYFNKNNYFNFLNIKNKWNLYNLNNNNNFNNSLIKIKNKLFYLNNVTMQDNIFYFINYNEFFNLFNNTLMQFNQSKWNRWLYKYSILHRKMFKNSHKITITKKILNSGFYNTNMSKKNLWNSQFLMNTVNANMIHNVTELFYLNLSKTYHLPFIKHESLINNNLNYNLNYNLLKFYEQSYFWFIKRFYFFNNLSQNKINTNFILNKNNKKLNNLQIRNNFLFKYDLNFSLLLKLTSFNLNDILFFYKKTEKNFNNNKKIKLNFQNKDIFLLFNDLDIFKKDNMLILNWISTETSISDFNLNKINYFNYLNFILKNKNTMLKNNFIITDNNQLNNNILNNNLKNLLNLDNFFYKDFIFLNTIFNNKK